MKEKKKGRENPSSGGEQETCKKNHQRVGEGKLDETDKKGGGVTRQKNDVTGGKQNQVNPNINLLQEKSRSKENKGRGKNRV